VKLRTSVAAVLTAAGITTLSVPAHAAGGAWDTALGPGSGTGATSASPWISAPAAGSIYAEWNFFTDEAGATFVDLSPDIGSFGLGGGTASVTETSGGGFFTGGNIYSFSTATVFNVATPGGLSGIYDVWLRIATLGTVANTTATLNGVAAERVESFSGVAGGMGGDEKEWYWKWTVPATGTYSFAFGAPGPHMSLDQVAIYAAAAPVPEPGTYAMLGLGLAGMALAGRRRRR
jgi:hypothetical protein